MTQIQVLYVEMTRITRKDITFSVSSILPSGAAGTLTGVDLAVLPKRQDPNGNTTWTPAAFNAGDATFWIVGPDGDPTGALVINYDDYVWAWPKGIPEIEPVKIVRARVRGPNPAAPPNAGTVSYATTAALTAALAGKADAAALAGYELKVSRSGATTGQVPTLQANGSLTFAAIPSVAADGGAASDVAARNTADLTALVAVDGGTATSRDGIALDGGTAGSTDTGLSFDEGNAAA